MSDFSGQLQELLAKELAIQYPELVLEKSEIKLERPKDRNHGDFATSIALALSKKLGKSPSHIATSLIELLQNQVEFNNLVSKVEIAGPGFLNITLATAGQGSIIAAILREGERYGHAQTLSGTRINLEFISANPTGPLHLGHTRWAAVGDALEIGRAHV